VNHRIFERILRFQAFLGARLAEYQLPFLPTPSGDPRETVGLPGRRFVRQLACPENQRSLTGPGRRSVRLLPCCTPADRVKPLGSWRQASSLPFLLLLWRVRKALLFLTSGLPQKAQEGRTRCRLQRASTFQLLISAQTGLPAELKHISKRRKRN
jgi:hypothetical protein